MSPEQEARTVRLAVIPGDGIGPEVIAEAEKVLDAATAGSGIRFDRTRFSLGAARFLDTGETLTDDDLAAAPGLADVVPDLRAALKGRVLVAHYAPIEIGLPRQRLRRRPCRPSPAARRGHDDLAAPAVRRWAR